MSNSWDARSMRIAREAASWSKDPVKQVGAVVVSADRRSWSPGYNGFPRGVQDNYDDAESKNEITVHAEVNAVLNAQFDTRGCTVYVTKHPCVQCAALLIQAGICRVVCPEPLVESKWYSSTQLAKELLSRANVALTYSE